LRLRNVIDVAGGEGGNQILGGMFPDGCAGPHSLFLLPRNGPRLRVSVAPLTGRPDLAPLAVRIEIDGAPAGTLTVAAEGVAESVLELPAPLPGRESEPIEVRLVAERQVVVRHEDASKLVSCRPARLEILPE
jgi:hypothetical protein